MAVYRALDLIGRKDWPQAGLKDGRWVPARPEDWGFGLQRIRNAWLVLIGRYDCLDWNV